MAWNGTRTWVTGEIVTATIGNQQWRDNLDAIAAVGDYKFKAKAGTTVETVIDGGWLECNGSSVSRVTYSALNTLLAALSYPFGAGDGSSTFTLPDLRGREWIAAGGSGGHADVALGNNEGVALASRRPRHKHTVTGGTIGFFSGGSFGSGSSGQTLSTILVGPQTGAEPTDSEAYLVAGIVAIKF
jgi:hypothetical protein